VALYEKTFGAIRTDFEAPRPSGTESFRPN